MSYMADITLIAEGTGLSRLVWGYVPSENFKGERLWNAVLRIPLEIFPFPRTILEKVKTPRILRDYKDIFETYPTP